MARLRLAGALGLALALTSSAGTVAVDDPPTPETEAASGALQQAMAYVRPRSDWTGFSFVDWAQLKQRYGAEALDSSSSIEERQRFLLEVARNESLPFPLGIDRLATWSDTWGWDTTDLEWQAHYRDERIALRFGEHWDAAPFRAALESFGYEVAPGGEIEVWRPPEAEMPTDLRLERVGGSIVGPGMSQSYSAVTIDGEERTVVIHGFAMGASPKQLRRASRPRPKVIADTPAGRAAAALGDVASASLAASRQMLCAWPGDEGPLAGNPEVTAIVDGLHQYEARAEGYRRATADGPAKIRYVFSYARPALARADLEGRSTLVEMGLPWGPLAADLTLLDARVHGSELILEVEPVSGHPGPYQGPRTAWAPFAMCGDGS